MKAVNKIKLFAGIMIVPLAFLITSLVNQDDRKENPDADPQKELESFKIADGFEVTLFAAEPLVIKPIQMNWDEDGRLWVVSSSAYPHLKTGEQANDKIFVLEDTDGDGKADKSTVFAEGLITPTGILPGDGGVYVANSTEILHFADTDGDGKADKRRRILNGFGTGDTHHLIHTFRWAPEGNLYFAQSIYINSHVETPFGVRRLEGGGAWQLNPKTLKLEVYARGLVNPWGLQFDKWGQSFLTDGAGGEGINYAFPGATFLTAPGAERIIRGLNPGQPKHSGLDVISGRHLPESWLGSVITNDFRANRINRFRLEEQGSGYASKQVEDVMWTDNVAFRPVDINVGPDGAIYVADWYNPIIQHGEVDFHDPRRDHEHGRIWKITAKNRALVKTPKLSKASISELLEALKLPEDLTRLNAKQVLKNRGAKDVIPALQTWVNGLDKNDSNYEHNLLEALWVYQSLDTVNESLLLSLLNAKSHNARAAGLRTLNAWYNKIGNASTLLAKAVEDKHPQVRLEAVIALRNARSAEGVRTALAVVEQPMDEFLDYALWQTVREQEAKWSKRLATEPEFFGAPKKTVFALKSVTNPAAITQLTQLYQKNQIPAEYLQNTLTAIARNGKASDLNILFEMALKGGDANKGTAAQLAALEEAARQRGVQPDSDLSRIASLMDSEDDAVSLSSTRLIGYWKLESLNNKLVELTKKGDKNTKRAALVALASMDKANASKVLIDIATGKNTDELRLLAAVQLVSVNVEEAGRITPALLNSLSATTDASELFTAFYTTRDGIGTLAKALTGKKIPVAIAKAARQAVQTQVRSGRQKDEDVVALKKALEATGGTLPVERMPQQLSDQEIANLAKDVRSTADADRGELIFRKSSCFTCHALGGAGGLIGPDLSSLGTSSPVETIIKSIIYPTVSIKEGYELQRIAKKDGSELLGYLVSNGNTEIVMRDVSGLEVAVPKSQIEAMEKVPGSLMPAGLTAGLDKQEFVDLIGYLSKLGESGKYRVPNTRFVRRWETVSGSKELTKKAGAEGLAYFIKPNAKVPYQAAYSKVAGDLPVDELPVVDLAGKRYSLVRFEIEVLTKGNVNLAMNSTAGVSAWDGQKSLKLTENGVVADLSQGIHSITVAVDRNAYKEATLGIELKDADSAPAQTRLRVGR